MRVGLKKRRGARENSAWKRRFFLISLLPFFFKEVRKARPARTFEFIFY
jgi:hypothetical protein